MTMLPENVENERALLPMFSSFMKEFKLNQLFRKCHIYKEKGIPVKEVFQMIFLLALTGKSFSSFLHSRNNPFQGKKDTIYRFLQQTRCNWRKFLFLLSTKVVNEALLPFTTPKRYTWVVPAAQALKVFLDSLTTQEGVSAGVSECSPWVSPMEPLSFRFPFRC